MQSQQPYSLEIIPELLYAHIVKRKPASDPLKVIRPDQLVSVTRYVTINDTTLRFRTSEVMLEVLDGTTFEQLQQRVQDLKQAFIVDMEKQFPWLSQTKSETAVNVTLEPIPDSSGCYVFRVFNYEPTYPR